MDELLKKADGILTGLISPGDRILVGVSGGADSIALLHVLNRFSSKKKFSLAVAHINHMARGEDSFKDAEFVKSVAEKLGLPFFLQEIDVQKERLRLKQSFQESARLIRYKFFEETLGNIDGNKIAVGHSADDQVETILMNFVRGSGLKGLTGIPQVRGKIIRPFLGFYRKDLEGYLEENKIPFREDLSNSNRKYLRNRVRHELIPYLKSYNPNIKKNLQEMSGIMGQDDALLDQLTRDIFNQNVPCQEFIEKEIRWNTDHFLSHPVSLRQRLIREIYFRITGTRFGITAHHIQKVVRLFESPKVGKTIHIPGKIKVTCGYGSVLFERENKEKSERDIHENNTFSIPIPIPGFTELTQGEIRVQTQILEDKREFSSLDPNKQAFLDLDKTGLSIKARYFRPGDRFRPLGMMGNKKLKSLFIDSKVPKSVRHRIPILTNAKDDIIWVYGQRIAHFCRVTDKTTKILFVQGNKVINY